MTPQRRMLLGAYGLLLLLAVLMIGWAELAPRAAS